MKYWSLFFGLIALLAVGAFVYAPFDEDWWLPGFQATNPNALASSGSPEGPLSTAAIEVDHLFIVILGITGLTFVGVMGFLVVALWRFGAQRGRRADYYHGSLRLEILWTLIPAAILIFLAFYQFGAWADLKFRSTWPDVQPVAEVTGRQFQWRIRYPGLDGAFDTADDIQTVNDLHFVKDTPTIILLKSEDVLHSFFLPQLRIKQDAVPGLTIPVKFDANRAGKYELLCAELCGWGHYTMRAEVTVHESEGDFREWLAETGAEQQEATPAPPDVAQGPGPRVE